MDTSPDIRTAPPDVAANATIAMLASVFYMATRLLVPPLVLAHLTLAQYGLWSACFVLIMYIGLTDAGFSSVYVRLTAVFHAAGDLHSLNRLLSTGVLSLTVLSSGVLLLLWLALPLLLAWLRVAPADQATARILITGTAAIFLLDLTLGAYCYVLHGLQRIREEKTVAVAGFILEPLLLALFLHVGLGIHSLLLAFAIRYLCSLAAFARLAHRFVPGLALRPRHFAPEMLRHFVVFGGAVQASTLLSTALFSLDRVLAGILLGPAGIALFELGGKLPIAAAAVPGSISNVTYPAAARHVALDAQGPLRALYVQSSRATIILTGLPLGFLAGFATPIVATWLGSDANLAQLPLLLALCALPTQLHIATGPATTVFRASGNVGNDFVYHALRVTALSGCCALALMLLGTSAAALAIGLAAGGVMAAGAYLVYSQRRLGVPLTSLLHEILLPGLLPYPLALALYTLWRMLDLPRTGRLDILPYLILFGLLYGMAWAACTWAQLSNGERQWLAVRWRAMVGTRPAWRRP